MRGELHQYLGILNASSQHFSLSIYTQSKDGVDSFTASQLCALVDHLLLVGEIHHPQSHLLYLKITQSMVLQPEGLQEHIISNDSQLVLHPLSLEPLFSQEGVDTPSVNKALYQLGSLLAFDFRRIPFSAIR